MEGYRLITTTYTAYPINRFAEAKAEALKRRGEGKRTEIITEEEYQRNHQKPMQDLTNLEEI
jgi:hypothetical protein